MDRNTQTLALRAAARVAFSFALVGCTTNTGADAKTISADTDVAPSEEVCKTVLDKAFPDGGPRKMSAEVERCCSVSIYRTEFGNKRIYDCCKDAQPGTDLQRACSPWGPPVPPSISWREVA